MDRRTFLCTGLYRIGRLCFPANDTQRRLQELHRTAVLGEILKQALESACRMPVDGRFYLAGPICQQAILAGRIDTYVEYTGTALLRSSSKPRQAIRRQSTSR